MGTESTQLNYRLTSNILNVCLIMTSEAFQFRHPCFNAKNNMEIPFIFGYQT
jgi:hypothetical protein